MKNTTTTRYYTWTLAEGTREHASQAAQAAHWEAIQADPHARYWIEIPRTEGD